MSSSCNQRETLDQPALRWEHVGAGRATPPRFGDGRVTLPYPILMSLTGAA
jgi:hypothetical protein